MRRFYPLWLCLLAVVLGSPQAQAQCDDKNPQCGGGQGQDNGGSGWTWEDVKKLPDRVVDGIENATNKAADWCEEAWNNVGDYLGLWGDDPPPPPPPSSQDYYNVGTQTGGAIREKLWSDTASAKVPQPAQQSSSAPALPAREQGRSKALAGPAQPDRGLADDPGSQRADADPVALRTGEFVHQTVDLEVLGGQLPFGLARTCRSRRAYEGPLGESWDHSLNMRVHLQRNSACIKEIAVSLGDLGPVRMRADARPQSGVIYYPVEPGLAWKMDRHDGSQDCAWRLIHTNGLKYCFDNNGLGRSVVASEHERIEIAWEEKSAGEWSEWYVSSADRVLAGKVTHHITFQYKEPTSENTSGSSKRRVVGTQLQSATLFAAGQKLGQVTYEVARSEDAPAGRLLRVWDVWDEQTRPREEYSYPEYKTQSLWMTPFAELREYCQNFQRAAKSLENLARMRKCLHKRWMSHIRFPENASFTPLVVVAEDRDCEHCGGFLYVLETKHRYVWSSAGATHLIVRRLHCPDPSCAGHKVAVGQQAELAVALPYWSVTWDVFAWMGHRRFSRHWSVPQIRAELQDRYRIEVSSDWIEDYLRTYQAMVSAREADVEQWAADYQKLDDVILAADSRAKVQMRRKVRGLREIEKRLLREASTAADSEDHLSGDTPDH